MFASILIFWAFVQMFIFCNLGENMTTRFSQIDNLIYCCDWYTFPYEIQRILPTVMMSAQQPIIFQGFANLKCTREAFKKVKCKYILWQLMEKCLIFFVVFRWFKEDSLILWHFNNLHTNNQYNKTFVVSFDFNLKVIPFNVNKKFY